MSAQLYLVLKNELNLYVPFAWQDPKLKESSNDQIKGNYSFSNCFKLKIDDGTPKSSLPFNVVRLILSSVFHTNINSKLIILLLFLYCSCLVVLMMSSIHTKINPNYYLINRTTEKIMTKVFQQKKLSSFSYLVT